MTIKIEKRSKVSTIIIDRPEARNAINRATADALADAFRDFEADDDSRAAVLCGAGENFCAGADLKELAKAETIEECPLDIRENGDGPMGMTRTLTTKPVIAAISGYVLAGGLEIALWCDMRVIEKNTVFGIFNRRWGVPLIDGGTIRLPRLIGLSRALDIILTGRPVYAKEALNIGLANRLAEEGRSRETAEKLAAEIAEFPSMCVKHDRLSAYEQFGMDLPEALVNEMRHGMKVIQSDESYEGAKRFASGKGRHGSFEY